MNLIKVKNCCLGYENREVAHNLNFCVNEGDYLCIVGENGSGKSTLMKALLGLKSVMHGEIILADNLTYTQIGYLPQQTEVQKDFPASVWEIVLSGRQGKMGLLPFYRKIDKKIAHENIEKMGLKKLTYRSYKELSGGQQQRVLLARALCATEKILLLDEPVTALDPVATKELYALIKKLNEDKITIIMISHDIDAVIKDATHILHIKQDTFFGTKEQYLELVNS